MPFLKFQGRIHYIDNKHDCNFICQNIIESKQTACGFDIEWKVSYKAGEGMRDTAVFQICSSEIDCYVFQVSAMNGFPIALKCLVEDATIIKAGVGIQGDMSKISLEYKLKPDGVADLSTMLNEIKSINENWSLNGMLVHLLKKRLNKDPTIRCSNWERYPLTQDQLEYAATDAYFEEDYPEEDVRGPTAKELSKAHEHIQNFGFAPCRPEPKNPISLLLEVGQKLHVTPRYFVSKSKHSSIYTCEVRFYGYKAKGSSNWKKISKQDAAKDLLDQIVKDATRTSELPEFLGGSMKIQSLVPRSTSMSMRSMSQSPRFDGVIPCLQFTGEIHYILNGKDCLAACKKIMQSSDGPVICGFDIEWKPNCMKGQNNKTAVIQICPSEKDCYIFQVSTLKYIPTSLKNLLEDNDIIKAGLGISGDISKIRADFGIRLANTVDLSNMYNRVIGSRRIWGIKSMLQQLLNKSKDDSEKLSNWEDFPLTREQLMYAATDAYAGLLLYKKIKEMPGGNKMRAGGNVKASRRNRNGRVSVVTILQRQGKML